MARRPHYVKEEESPQELIERVAEVTGVLFQAPRPLWGYLFILLAPMILLPILEAASGSWRQGAILTLGVYIVPTLVFALVAHPLALLLGGTFNRRRAVFLSASVLLFQIVVVGVGWFVARRGVLSLSELLIISYSFVLLPHQMALFTTSDDREWRSALVALVHPALGLIAIERFLPTGPRETALSLLMPAMFLFTTIFFLEMVDVPVRKNTGLSLSEMFRHYLDHLSHGSVEGERLVESIATEIEAHVGVVGFRRKDGSIKAAIVVPAVHPGPLGHLGGSNLPAKIAAAVGAGTHVLVPHGPATHDFNPASTHEVERLGEEARRLLKEMTWSVKASPFIRTGKDVQVAAQVFGDAALLTYTSWPKPIDDVDFGVGEAAMLSAQLTGVRDALFIDAHNSLVMGSGAVFPSTARAEDIIRLAREATGKARERVTAAIQIGYAQDREDFSREEGVGEQGCQVLATHVGGKTNAYILWDGNNMVPDVRAAIRDALGDAVDEFEVLTTDNHSVNAIAGGFNPVGFRMEHRRLAEASRRTLEAALADLEPVETGLNTGRVAGFRVLGHWNTMRLLSSVHTITGMIPRAAVAMLLLQAALAVLVLLGTHAYLPTIP